MFHMNLLARSHDGRCGQAVRHSEKAPFRGLGTISRLVERTWQGEMHQIPGKHNLFFTYSNPFIRIPATNCLRRRDTLPSAGTPCAHSPQLPPRPGRTHRTPVHCTPSATRANSPLPNEPTNSFPCNIPDSKRTHSRR